MTKRFESQKRDERWYSMWKSGTTQKEIAEHCDVTQAYVSKRIRKYKERVGSARRSEPTNYDIHAVKLILKKDNENVLRRLEEILEARSEDVNPAIELAEALRSISALHQAEFSPDHMIRFADIVHGFSRWIDKDFRPYYKRCECQN